MKKIIIAIVLCAALSACAQHSVLGRKGEQLGVEWIEQNPWYRPNSDDPDSVFVRNLDRQLYSEGYNPETQAYWDELTRRAKTALPHHFKISADERGGLEATNDPWCGGYKPKTAQYKKCIANREKEMAKREKERAAQLKKEQAEIERYQHEAALAQARQPQQQAPQAKPCEINMTDTGAAKASARNMIADGSPNVRASGEFFLARAYKIDKDNALCRGDTQAYYQIQQLEMQEKQLQIQQQQLQQQRANSFNNGTIQPTTPSTMHCQPDYAGGVVCKSR